MFFGFPFLPLLCCTAAYCIADNIFKINYIPEGKTIPAYQGQPPSYNGVDDASCFLFRSFYNLDPDDKKTTQYYIGRTTLSCMVEKGIEAANNTNFKKY